MKEPQFKFKWLLVHILIAWALVISGIIVLEYDSYEDSVKRYERYQESIPKLEEEILVEEKKYIDPEKYGNTLHMDGWGVELELMRSELEEARSYEAPGDFSSKLVRAFSDYVTWVVTLIAGVAFGPLLYSITYFFLVLKHRFSSKKDRSQELASKALEYQERLGDDFFNSLVKLNFNYLDAYYLQTQTQADKSFLLAAIAAGISFFVILAGIIALFFGVGDSQDSISPAEITVAVGAFGEFISAVFFYLYNRTVLKMGEYHQKLVLTQNIASAIKITNELPESEKAKAQQDLVKSLVTDINMYLSKNGSESLPAS